MFVFNLVIDRSVLVSMTLLSVIKRQNATGPVCRRTLVTFEQQRSNSAGKTMGRGVF